MAQPSENLQIGDGNSDGLVIGRSDDLVAFYGATPAAQRAYTSTVHLSSELATSTDFGTTQLAVVNELQATMVALGIWATA